MIRLSLPEGGMSAPCVLIRQQSDQIVSRAARSGALQIQDPRVPPNEVRSGVRVRCPRCVSGRVAKPLSVSAVRQGAYGNCGACWRQMRAV